MKKECPCRGCVQHYGCKKISDAGGYPYWGCLARCMANNNGPVWLRHALIRAAKKFVPNTIFRGTGSHSVTDAPYGDYIWHFVIEMRQEQLWNYREFQEGYVEGTSAKPDRDHNPYVEPARHSSWDKGYILGLYEREIEDQ